LAKILILDIETAPNVAYVWRFFKENIGAKQVVENGYILSYAAKWYNENGIFYEDKSNQHEKTMLLKLHRLLDEADIVVAHNGNSFDLPHIQGRFVAHGIQPPAPYKQVDTRLIAKKEFNFPSNSLEYLSNTLELKNKKDGHKKFPGFELWLGVLRDDPEAWKEMREYNIIDILALEELYTRFLPFIRNHPNVAIFDDGEHVCPKCGGNHLQSRGYAHTTVGRYKRFQCQGCGGWSRSRIGEKGVSKVQVNAIN
jgi:DNA polymerase elongation subunit (family B)